MLPSWDHWEQPRWKRQLATSTFQWTCHDLSGPHQQSAARRPGQTAPGQRPQYLCLPSLQEERSAQDPDALQRMSPRFLSKLSGCMPLLYAGRIPHGWPSPATDPAASLAGHRRNASDLPPAVTVTPPDSGRNLQRRFSFSTAGARTPRTAVDTRRRAPARSSPSPYHSAADPATQPYP